MVFKIRLILIIRELLKVVPRKGVSENIRVISIVGKYLEHARIYYFKNAPTPIYFASADIMPRNLERRIEILTPSISEEIARKLLEIVTIQLKDNLQAHELQSNGEYKKLSPDQNPINCKYQIRYSCQLSRMRFM